MSWARKNIYKNALKVGGQTMGVPLKIISGNEQRLYLVLGGESAELMLWKNEGWCDESDDSSLIVRGMIA